jgi:S1-C subfamily serine protease
VRISSLSYSSLRIDTILVFMIIASIFTIGSSIAKGYGSGKFSQHELEHQNFVPSGDDTKQDILEHGSLLSITNPFPKIANSVVQVESGSNSGGSKTILGSGFVYDNNGHIVTNYHVVEANMQDGNAQVTLINGNTYDSKLVGVDRLSDLAVLRLVQDEDTKLDGLVPLSLGNSSSLLLGQSVLAIGSPFGLSGSMTLGTITGLGQIIPSSDQNYIPDIIQTNASLGPGSSGGPLLNMESEVIGINSAIYAPDEEFEGISYSIPSNTIKRIVPSLISMGSYQHPYLGIVGVNITPEIAKAIGLKEKGGFLVTEVGDGSPAENAGIHVASELVNIDGRDVKMGGDAILMVDGKTVTRLIDILTILEREKKAGDPVRLTIFRDGKIHDVSLRLGAKT